jgi:hypothetical protein
LVRGRLEIQPDVNPLDHEDLVVRALDFTDRFAGEAVTIGPDVARLQRASEGPRQSAGRSGDDVVERGCPRLDGTGSDLVVFGHGAVNAEDDWLGLTGQEGAAHRSFDALDADLRAVHDSGHGVLLMSSGSRYR